MRLADVVAAWRVADPKHIHPTREHVSEAAYWESGRAQAEVVFDLVGGGAWVLDFGCGDGRIAIPMAQMGLHVVALDAAPEMIERLYHQMNVQGLAPGMIRGLVTDGVNSVRLSKDLDGQRKDPVPDFGFDAVNCRAVLIHHSHADGSIMVQNLARLLKPGGFLVADWPKGDHYERRDWIDVTTWDESRRNAVAETAGLELVSEGVPTVSPSVWRKV